MVSRTWSAYRQIMSGSDTERVSIELTPAEAKLVIAALRRFEPYWPGDMDDLTRTELLTGIRVAIDRVTSSLAS
ncbi:MAG: hypothetical protein JWP74_1367 [Marmoricola sp.]|nr:hypothetical protein [Marmoricola sp.]